MFKKDEINLNILVLFIFKLNRCLYLVFIIIFYKFQEYLVFLDNINGNTFGINNKKKKIDFFVNQGIWWYEVYGGNCSKGEFQVFGVYVLRIKGERYRVLDKEM